MDPTLDTYIDEHGERQPTPAMARPGLCERTGGHRVVRPRIWPPVLRGHAGSKGKDYGAARCLRCGATVIIYEVLPEGVRWAEDAPPTPPRAA